MAASRKDENAEATRRGILKSARRIFGKRGYGQTSLEAITSDARVTTGALYHHFGGKEALFQAVAEDVEASILAAVTDAAARENDSWRSLSAGIDAMLDMATRNDVRQIVFLDAPRVFGPAEWRAIESKYAYGLLKAGLTRLAQDGVTKALAPEIAAPILLGALIEAANTIAEAKGSSSARREARRIIDAILSGLRA
jgi:AcrR family transcriptional regulator